VNELAHAKTFGSPPSFRAIRHWQDAQPTQFTPAEEKVIANALARAAGASDRDLVKYFAGLISFIHTPGAAQQIERV